MSQQADASSDPSVPLFLVAAFTGDGTGEGVAGNPAGVCILDAAGDPAWMQSVAAAVGASETAFAFPLGDGRWSLRWFTPTVEVPLCGHATLATAHVLREEGHETPLRFETASGELVADADGDLLELDLPASTPTTTDLPPELERALGVQSVASATGGDAMWLVEVASADDVRSAAPDMAALAALPTHGVIVTAAGDEPDTAVVSRFFAPAIGIDEDPVTGAAHCLLAPWWVPRVGAAFTARQLSARGGLLEVHLDGDRVRLGGRAETLSTTSVDRSA